MEGLERQLRDASTKAQLHEMIDALPEDGTAILITRKPSTDRDGDPAAVVNAMCYPFAVDTFHLIGWLEHVKHALLSSATEA